MIDFSDFEQTKENLEKDQNADFDRRNASRDVEHFLHKPDGQWEPHIVRKYEGKPKYTFDKCTPIVDAIMGEMDRSDFFIKVRPAGGEASKDTAQTLDGIIRNIQNISNADQVFSASARTMIESGIDGWGVRQQYVDSDSFEQDLVIYPIRNFKDRVWFDRASEEQDASDAKYAFMLTMLSKRDYDYKWPDRNGVSVTQSRVSEVYQHKKEHVVVGEIYYKKHASKEIVQMSNGAVYEVDDDFESVVEELSAAGITETGRRKRDKETVYTRKFDGEGWLEDEQETVFDYIPIIPVYGNFKISESKVIYRGAIERLMDAQRVLNYAESRDIEEGALSPREKIWMTTKAAGPHLSKLITLNNNSDPVQFYEHVDGENPPFKLPANNPNQNLRITAQSASEHINTSTGMFTSNFARNEQLQSGVAIGKQIDKGDNATYKYFTSMEIGIQHTCKILCKAIPKVYDTKRTVRIIGMDGAEDFVTIKDVVIDEQTKRPVEINDLSKGLYDVTCSCGPAFQNKQQETVETIKSLAEVDPTIIQIGKDILLRNINAPDIDKIADRVRLQMITQGLIPQDQMTDEEKMLMQQLRQQQGQQQNPQEQAMLSMAQAEVEKAQAQTADTMSKINERIAKTELETLKIKQKNDEIVLKGQTEQQKINLQLQQQLADFELTQQQMLKTMAETLNEIRQATGAEAIMGPQVVESYIGQAESLNTEINQQGTGPNPGIMPTGENGR